LSFVEENANACHSESATADEESPHLKAQTVRKNAEMLRYAQHDRPEGSIKISASSCLGFCQNKISASG
jgi:hypothetical protein